jgi:hypothetical protein
VETPILFSEETFDMYSTMCIEAPSTLRIRVPAKALVVSYTVVPTDTVQQQKKLTHALLD